MARRSAEEFVPGHEVTPAVAKILVAVVVEKAAFVVEVVSDVETAPWDSFFPVT